MKNKDFIDELSKSLPPERVNRAKKEAEREILNIRLAQLRKHNLIKQSDVKSFSQSSISRIEARKDIKISTLLKYLDSIGMDVEIYVYPKGKRNKKIALLK
jgi:hypothetical protein